MLNAQTATTALIRWCNRRGVEAGTGEFLEFLSDRNALYLLPAIRARLEDKRQRNQQRNLLSVKTGQELTDQQQSDLQSASGATSETTSVTRDQELIGGVEITQGGHRVRATVTQQISALQDFLTQPEKHD